jgi:uncharacterized alpha-E superfamily protein
MLARAAEYLFWAGRYLERAEQTARLLDITYHRLLEAPPNERAAAWREALELLGLADEFEATDRPLTAANVCDFLVVDPTNPGSISSAVEQARSNARGVREHLSIELWEAINSFCLEIRERDLPSELETQPHALFGFVRRQSQGIVGVANATWSRSDGWRFFTLGLFLERADMTARLVRIRQPRHLGGAEHEWYATLRVGSALQAHRRRYHGAFDPVSVAEVLLTSTELPRSLRFCLREASTILDALDSSTRRRSTRLLGRLRSRVEYLDVDELVRGDLTGELLDVELQLRRVADAVVGEYFGGRHDLDLHHLQLAPVGPDESGGW